MWGKMLAAYYKTVGEDVWSMHCNKGRNLPFQVCKLMLTQSNERARELSNFALVAALCDRVPGSVGTAMHVLVQAAYLHVFMDVKEGPFLSMGARVVLAVFALSAVIAQRLNVFSHADYNLRVYSLTAPTF
jgi:hypothetical protein